jgi:hypothetical protein
VADQIDFDETGPLLVPLRKRADRDLMLQQRTGLGAGAPMQLQTFALRGKQPINGRRTDLQEFLA